MWSAAIFRPGNRIPDPGRPGVVARGLGLLEKVGFRWLYPAKGVYIPALKTVSVPDDLKVTDQPPFVLAHAPV